jgi:hypothetical protein
MMTMTMLDIETSREVIMNAEATKSVARLRKPRKRKFFIVQSATASRASGFRLLNKSDLFIGNPPTFFPPAGRRGFRDYPVRPAFVADPKLGRLHWDLEEYSGYWFVSERMKSVLQEIDPEAFVFLACDIQSPDGTPQPPRWLCDIVRVLDALDEGRSETRNAVAKDGSKYYVFAFASRLVFKENVVGNARIFRMKFSIATIMCDAALRLACKAVGLKGTSFRPTE